MSLDHKIRLIAGTFILLSLALGWFVSPWWFLFTAFVGLNLIQSAISKWCLMEDILKRTGIHSTSGGRGREPRGIDEARDGLRAS